MVHPEILHFDVAVQQENNPLADGGKLLFPVVLYTQDLKMKPVIGDVAVLPM